MAEMFVNGVKLDACLGAEADAIRAKTGSTVGLTFDFANNKGFADAIAAIPSGGGGTLRTTHYHGTLSYSNATVYKMVIPVADILATDMIVVAFQVTRTGIVTDGVIAWDEELMVPAAMNNSGKRFTVCGRASINYGNVNIKTADLSTNYNCSILSGTCRQIYNNNAGNNVDLTPSVQQGVSITLTPQGYNGKLCAESIATEYEYDVYIMTEDGNAIVSGG